MAFNLKTFYYKYHSQIATSYNELRIHVFPILMTLVDPILSQVVTAEETVNLSAY